MSSDSRSGLLGVCGSLLGLSIVAVGTRFVARAKQKASLLADDWTIFASTISYLGASICVFLLVHDKDLGYSSSSFTAEETIAMGATSNKLQIAWDVLEILTLGLTKISILLFYRRVFCITAKISFFNVATSLSIALLIIWVIVFSFLAGFQCHGHFSALWDGSYLEYCTISFNFLYGLVVSDFLLDIWVLALPIPEILRLHASKSKRISIVGVFILAFVGLGASIARMTVFVEIDLAGPEAYISQDQERVLTRYFYLSMLEAGIALVAANLPSLWFLFTTVLPEKLLKSFSSLRSLRSASTRDPNQMSDPETDGAVPVHPKS